MRRFKRFTALDGLHLEIAAGERYALLGPNGAGKSTLLMILATLLRPTSGRACIAGFDVVQQSASVRRIVGVSSQHSALDGFLTGREHLEFQAGLRRIPRPRARALARELLEHVDLVDAADKKVAFYSGGMQRRLDFALALVGTPAVLLLDEPSTGLDPVSRERMWREIERRSEEDGVTVLLTTQHLEEAERIAQRVGILVRGSLSIEGTPEELRASLGQRTVEVVVHDPEDLDAACAALADSGYGLQCRGTTLSFVPHDARLGVGEVAARLHKASITVASVREDAPTLDEVVRQQVMRPSP